MKAQTEERPEVYRGHLKECLVHLGRQISVRAPPMSKGVSEARAPIKNFCGVTDQTIREWFNPKGITPLGEYLFRVYCFLDLIGYRVIEFERMPKVQRNFVEIIGFRLITGEQATSLLGYTHTPTLYQVLQGKEGASDEKEQRMGEAWKSKREELDARKKATEVYQLNPSTHTSAQAKKEETGANVPVPEPRASKVPRMDIDRKIALNMMDGLLTLLNEGVFDVLSPQQLDELYANSQAVLGLTIHLNDLSSRIIIHERMKGAK